MELRLICVQTGLKVAVSAVDGGHRIVSSGAIFGHQGSDRGLGIAVEQRVVAHAQTQADVELGLCPVEELRLSDGVAHHLIGPGTDPVLWGHPNLILGDGARLADDRGHLEAVPAQDPFHNLGLPVQAGTEGLV